MGLTSETLSEVLDHVVPLGLSVDEEVESDPLLEGDDSLDLLGDEVVVLGGRDLTLAELGTSNTDLLGLGEGSDGGGGCRTRASVPCVGGARGRGTHGK